MTTSTHNYRKIIDKLNKIKLILIVWYDSNIGILYIELNMVVYKYIAKTIIISI